MFDLFPKSVIEVHYSMRKGQNLKVNKRGVIAHPFQLFNVTFLYFLCQNFVTSHMQ